MQRSEKCRGTRQIALGLCDLCLIRERNDVVRYDIENLIKLSQRFGETTKFDIGILRAGSVGERCAGRAARLR